MAFLLQNLVLFSLNRLFSYTGIFDEVKPQQTNESHRQGRVNIYIHSVVFIPGFVYYFARHVNTNRKSVYIIILYWVYYCVLLAVYW